MVKIKVCGLRIPADVDAVNAFVPDYCGFIFAPERWRYVEPEKAEELRRKLDPNIEPVAVFVDGGLKWICKVLEVFPAGIVQLHGHETDADIDEIKAAIPGITVIKAFRIGEKADVDRAVSSHADLVLLDNGIGGTGKTFDWSLIRNCPRKFILAGGLGPDNVKEAIRLANPYAVDASSSLETDRHKDPEKIRRFIEAVRG